METHKEGTNNFCTSEYMSKPYKTRYGDIMHR